MSKYRVQNVSDRIKQELNQEGSLVAPAVKDTDKGR